MKLKDICSVFIDGDWIETKDQSDYGIRLIQTGNIGEGIFLEKQGKEKYISTETFKDLKCTEVFAGDLLISRLPEPIGRACIIPLKDDRMITAVDCTICRFDNSKVIAKYVCYFMQSKFYYNQLKKYTLGTTRKRISRKNLGTININVPNLSLQQKIIDVLDKIENLIDNRQQQLNLLDELIKSRFIEMFGDPVTNPMGWEIRNLSQIAEYFNGLTYSPDNIVDDGMIVLRSSNIQNGELDFNDIVRVNVKVKQNILVKDDDILMCSRNGSARLVGKAALIRDLKEPMTFGAFMMIIRSQYNKYLMQYLKLPAFRRQIKTAATTTINQITIKMLDDIKLPLPPIELQNKFAAFVEQVEKTKSTIKKSLDELNLLKDSLMQKYFG